MIDTPPPSPPPVPWPFVPVCLATGHWDPENAVCHDPTHNHRHQRPRPDYPMRGSTENRDPRRTEAPPYLPARANPNEQARRDPMEIPLPPDPRQQIQDSYNDRADLLDSLLRDRKYARDEPYREWAEFQRPRSPLIDIFGNSENNPYYNPHAGYRPRDPSLDDDRYARGSYARSEYPDVPPPPPRHQMRPGAESREIRGRPDDTSSRSRLNARPSSPLPPPSSYRPGQGDPRGESGRTQRYGPGQGDPRRDSGATYRHGPEQGDPRGTSGRTQRQGPDHSAESHHRNGARENRYNDWDNNGPADRGRAQPSRAAEAAQQQGLPAPGRPSNAADGSREGVDMFRYFFGDGGAVKPCTDRYR
jgi:hypothetical protein